MLLDSFLNSDLISPVNRTVISIGASSVFKIFLVEEERVNLSSLVKSILVWKLAATQLIANSNTITNGSAALLLNILAKNNFMKKLLNAFEDF